MESKIATNFPDLHSEMKCGIITNSKGDILIVHDKELHSEIQWVEYDQDEEKLFLIHEEGEAQDLGITLDQKMKNNISQDGEIFIAQVVDGEFLNLQDTTIIIKDY